MLWEIEIRPGRGEVDREGARVFAEARGLGTRSIRSVRAARSFLVEGDLPENRVRADVARYLADGVVEEVVVRQLPATQDASHGSERLLNVLFKPGVTDNVGLTARGALKSRGLPVDAVATCRKYWVNGDAEPAEIARLKAKVLSNDAIEHVEEGGLRLESLSMGGQYEFQLVRLPLLKMDDDGLMKLSREGQLSLTLEEMRTIQAYFSKLQRDPTDIELETIAQTWSEHCSHKTLRGRIRYRDEKGVRNFENLLKETVFAATVKIRESLGSQDWCVSVFRDNAGVVKFDDRHDVCIKVETHNHPSAIEPYGGANTGLGGVIRDPLGTGLGAKPIANTDVFCFASPDISHADVPKGALHPRTVMKGVVAGVRDYGNRMGIPTVNGAVFFDDRYLGNPLVFCGNVAMLPVGMSEKHVLPRDFVVAVGGRTGRDGIHGATFSSVELTHESEKVSGGAVQIGNAVVEKMVRDVVLAARDRGLYHAITDCGAGGFSSAVGEMGEETGAEVWLEKAPLKYSGLSYTEIWISEAQERMVLAVPPEKWDEFHDLCASEGVEATVIGKFTGTGRLELKYQGNPVGELSMHFLHEGRPAVVREANYSPTPDRPIQKSNVATSRHTETLKNILASGNVCSKEWIIRQYDHEVQAGSVVKPLVGAASDGPSDAAVVRPDLTSFRGLVISNGMNPRYGDLDAYGMATLAIDEAVRNCVAVGADPQRIAILDNFCWGNVHRPETLGSLVRAAIGCYDTAVAFGTPFVSGKDSLNNEFAYVDSTGQSRNVAIPGSLLISALGQIPDVRKSVTMDLKEPGNLLFLVGRTRPEFGGSHWNLVESATGGTLPKVDFPQAAATFRALHQAILHGLLRSCHDLSEGGLAVAVAEMAFAGGLGVDITISPEILSGDPAREGVDLPTATLFSESPSRFVLEVEPQHADKLKSLLRDSGVTSLHELGPVTAAPRVQFRTAAGTPLIDATCQELKHAWQNTLAWE